MRTYGPVSSLSAPTLALLALLLSAPTTLARGPAQIPDRTLSPYFVVKGAPGEVDALPLKATRADAHIAGTIAQVKVTQVYKNEGKTPLEAIYVFPGSTRSAVFGMTMTVGKRKVKAEIQRRDAARKLYEKAKSEGKTASLLEQQRPNVFQMNVANILPGDEVKVELEYTELLVPEDGVYELVYPAVVGPRYTEKTAGTAGTWDRFTKRPILKKGSAYDWDIRAHLETGVPIRSLRSGSHKIDTKRIGLAAADVRLADGEKGGASDFVLRWELRGDAVDSGVLLFPGGEESFFLAMVQPPKVVAKKARPAREYVFIVDVSGSMHGFPLNTAKALLARLLDGLGAQDRFNVLMFSGGSRVLAKQSLRATPANLAEALSVVGGVAGGGGTQLLPALKQALAMPAAEEMSRTFVVITDGYVVVEDQAVKLIRENLGKANLFAFGIGSSVNRHLVESVARAGMGQAFVVLNDDEAPRQAKRFLRYIESPALTRIHVAFEGLNVYDVEPASIPDLFAQRPVVVFGKYRGASMGKVIVTGQSGAGPFRKVMDLASVRPDPRNAALRYLWARSRIGFLSDMEALRQDPERTEQITNLGLKYGLMTKYTSFIAVDHRVRREGGKLVTVKQPVPLPKGVSERAVGGMGGHMGGKGRMMPAKLMRGPSAPPVSPAPSMDRPSRGRPAREEVDKRSTRPDANRVFARVVACAGCQVSAARAALLGRPGLLRRLQQLVRQAGLPKVVLTLVLDASGRVTAVRVSPRSAGHSSLEARLLQAVNGLRLPTARANAVVTLIVGR